MTDTREHQLPVPVHRCGGDRRDKPARRPRRLGPRQGLRERATAAGVADEYGDAFIAAGTEMADRFRRGGRLYTFGNGGSSTDAATLASLFSRPARGVRSPRGRWPPTRRW